MVLTNDLREVTTGRLGMSNVHMCAKDYSAIRVDSLGPTDVIQRECTLASLRTQRGS
jgi:hypothetical protein